jgi:hypothetical protein
MKHHPMTQKQREILDQDLATIVKNLDNISILLNACYGDEDPRVARSEESQAALQRLLWALERQNQPSTLSSEAGSACSPKAVEMNAKARRQTQHFGSASN